MLTGPRPRRRLDPRCRSCGGCDGLEFYERDLLVLAERLFERIDGGGPYGDLLQWRVWVEGSAMQQLADRVVDADGGDHGLCAFGLFADRQARFPDAQVEPPLDQG